MIDDNGFKEWLVATGDAPNTVNTRVATVRRLESAYGDLAKAFQNDICEHILTELTYSASDARRGEPNPSRLEMDGDIYKGLASCRTHLKKYIAYLAREEEDPRGDEVSEEVLEAAEARFGLEADLQTALRANISQLEKGMTIADGGSEQRVSSGFIDILAKDADGHHVVIELKAVTARKDAIAQCLAYMGDLAETLGQSPRGILIAPDFDAKAVSAARVVPSLTLKRYSFTFSFTDF
ncbi:endonuclease NucS domain-containing protein [Vannielia litorea]|uniref:endonuclease NucS domain-containing protein n=1 Tax=Vannielia litorea TaxID=1217970 RepID=UPI001C96AA5F|nr:endonuclease NucS domain-containing protein [Vannielia litorea]MBY6047306.1 DUF91 domain-containing protein [Vannielia litorea]MBY6074720.1 DUF91 domain-containing protein [Vannielia litorea]